MLVQLKSYTIAHSFVTCQISESAQIFCHMSHLKKSYIIAQIVCHMLHG